MLDDLEHALYDAGAISLNAAQNKFVRTPLPDSPEAEAEAEKLADEDEETEWFVSSPGKVILFGEHAVVHGVVCFSIAIRGTMIANSIIRLLSRRQSTSGAMASAHRATTARFRYTYTISITLPAHGTSSPSLGMLSLPSVLESSLPRL